MKVGVGGARGRSLGNYEQITLCEILKECIKIFEKR